MYILFLSPFINTSMTLLNLKIIYSFHCRQIVLYFLHIILFIYIRFYINFQEIPVWLRPHVYRAWARAFHSSIVVMPFFLMLTFLHFTVISLYSHHAIKLEKIVSDKLCFQICVNTILIPNHISDLEEAALPLDKYTSLREFFARALKEGSRPIDADPQCLVTGNIYLASSNIFICTICC